METSNSKELIREIIIRSESKVWEQACLEWNLDGIHRAEIPETCLCGHSPIIEICTIVNSINGNTAEVGNICAKKFMGFPSDQIFTCIKKIAADGNKGLNLATIAFAHDKGWIGDWEKDFSVSTSKKRKLSQKQLYKREQINNKVLAQVIYTRL